MREGSSMGEATAAAAAAAAGEADAAPRHTEKGAFFFFPTVSSPFQQKWKRAAQSSTRRAQYKRQINPTKTNQQRKKSMARQPRRSSIRRARTYLATMQSEPLQWRLPPPFYLAWVLANKLILLLLDRSTRFSRVRAVCFLAARHKQINPTSSPR